MAVRPCTRFRRGTWYGYLDTDSLLTGRRRLIPFLTVALLSTSLYGIYLSPPTMPRLMLYRLIQPVVLAGIIVSARVRHSRTDLTVLVLIGYSVIVMAVQSVG